MALLSTFLAWNRKDRDAFTANFTDTGLSGTVLSLPESLGDPAIAPRRIMEATVSRVRLRSMPCSLGGRTVIRIPLLYGQTRRSLEDRR